eukprot:7511-Heterococcus_DN1.PRE.1
MKSLARGLTVSHTSGGSSNCVQVLHLASTVITPTAASHEHTSAAERAQFTLCNANEESQLQWLLR